MEKFLLLCWQIVRCVLLGGFVLAGALTLLVGVGLLVNIPGCSRYERYCSYESKGALIAAELEDMRFCVDCTVNGTNVTIIAMRDCVRLYDRFTLSSVTSRRKCKPIIKPDNSIPPLFGIMGG